MNIIKREIRAYLKSNIIWSGCIIVFIIMIMSEFSAYYNNPEMIDILNSMPEALLEAMSMENANLTKMSGFVSLASIYFYIMLAIHGILLGSSIISKEERDKTCEFFLAMPISREKIMASKLAAALLLSLWVNLTTYVTIVLTSLQYEKKENFHLFLFLVMLSIFIMQLIFLSIGFLMASIVKRYKKSGAYSISLLLSMYIISIIVSLNDKIDFLKYFTPFKYYDANYILRNEGYKTIYVLLSALIIILALVISFIVYPKRDLKI